MTGDEHELTPPFGVGRFKIPLFYLLTGPIWTTASNIEALKRALDALASDYAHVRAALTLVSARAEHLPFRRRPGRAARSFPADRASSRS
jgi:hypothetical protein